LFEKLTTGLKEWIELALCVSLVVQAVLRFESCKGVTLRCGNSCACACRPTTSYCTPATGLRTINGKRLEAATGCTLRNVGLPITGGDVGVARSRIWHGVRGPDVAPPAARFHWLAQNQ